VRILLLAATLLAYAPFIFAEESIFWPSASPENGVIKLEKLNCSSGPYKPNLPNTLKEFKALGERAKEQVEPASDYAGDPNTHTSGNFWYDGMYLGVVFRNTKPYGNFLNSASFSHPRWNNLTPIKVGSSVLDLLAKENISAKPAKNSSLYLCSVYDSEGAPDCVKLTLKGNRIIKVEYQCYTG
jgi:hypothetical protein